MDSMHVSEPKLTTTYYLLKISYGLVFLVVGLDKFTHLIVNWAQYVNPMWYNLFHTDYPKFKYVIAAIEIIIGLLILGRSVKWNRIGAYLAAAWFFIIALQLVAMWQYLDIAARDVLLGIGAIALAWLTEIKYGY